MSFNVPSFESFLYGCAVVGALVILAAIGFLVLDREQKKLMADLKDRV